jgi:DNA adenine methylase
MLYLNKLGFNGLHRVNKNGDFNVPYGKVEKPLFYDEARIHACSDWLRYVEIRTGSYTSAINDATSGDFVYLDPPYIPLKDNSFSKYAKDDFKEIDQWALAGAIKGLTERGVYVMLSNSNTPKTLQIFGDALKLYSVSASRFIAASAASRANVEEIIGVNYLVEKAVNPEIFKNLTLLNPKADTKTVPTT